MSKLLGIGNYHKEEMLEFFRKHAPDAPVGKCLDYAGQLKRGQIEEYHLKCVLAVLSNYLCDSNGKIRDSVSLADMEPALKKAMEIVQSMHGWVVCGPGPVDPMGKLIDQFVKGEHTNG